MSEERCEQSDLLKSECAHCQGVELVEKPKQSDDPRPAMGVCVPAKYAGECPECGDPIDVGDMIGKAEADPEGPWIHYGCGR